jgi:hypothetical protein
MCIHRVDRVLGIFSSRPNWDSPNPLTRRRVGSPSFGSGGGRGTHSLAGEGVGGPNSDEGTDTVWCSWYTVYVLSDIYSNALTAGPFMLYTVYMCNCYVTKKLSCYKKEIFMMRESLHRQNFMQIIKIIYSYCSLFTKRKNK